MVWRVQSQKCGEGRTSGFDQCGPVVGLPFVGIKELSVGDEIGSPSVIWGNQRGSNNA